VIYLFDSDAFLCLRSLVVATSDESLLELVLSALPNAEPAVLTEYVALHELNAIAPEIEAFCARRVLRVEPIRKTDPAYRTFRALKVEVHKGEAESIAWAIHQNPKPLFVSRDGGALVEAHRRRVPRTDVMGFVVECVESGLLQREVAADALTPWADPEQQRCRPNDYEGFSTTYERRLRRIATHYF
jgi:predicted nucleic acid-binding protein